MTERTPRQADSVWREAMSTINSRRPIGGSIPTREVEARLALNVVVRERVGLQTRIVQAFQHHVETGGPGPTEADLMLFAQTAIAEQRLARSLVQAMLTRVALRR